MIFRDQVNKLEALNKVSDSINELRHTIYAKIIHEFCPVAVGQTVFVGSFVKHFCDSRVYNYIPSSYLDKPCEVHSITFIPATEYSPNHSFKIKAFLLKADGKPGKRDVEWKIPLPITPPNVSDFYFDKASINSPIDLLVFAG